MSHEEMRICLAVRLEDLSSDPLPKVSRNCLCSTSIGWETRQRDSSHALAPPGAVRREKEALLDLREVWEECGGASHKEVFASAWETSKSTP